MTVLTKTDSIKFLVEVWVKEVSISKVVGVCLNGFGFKHRWHSGIKVIHLELKIE
jgi:hypothetical protein